MKINIQSALGVIGTAAIATTVAAVTTISTPVAADAATIDFNNIVADNADEQKGDPLAQFLSMDVTASGGGTLFKFSLADNSLPGFGGSFIRQVFIDGSTTLLGAATVNSGNVVVGGVAFSGGPSNQNFAQGNKVGFSTDYYFNRNNGPANVNAIQKGESLGVLFANANFNNVIAAINSGDLRVGYHAQGLIDGASDSYINAIPSTPPPKPVPVPGFLLGFAVAGGFGVARVLKNKKQVA